MLTNYLSIFSIYHLSQYKEQKSYIISFDISQLKIVKQILWVYFFDDVSHFCLSVNYINNKKNIGN